MKKNSYTTEALRSFLESHPWPEEWRSLAEPLEYYYDFTLPVSPRDLWPLISDTSRVNELAGLPKMSFTEKDGVRYGSYRIMGVPMEWEEVPWQWARERSITMVRIFSRGVAHYMRGIFEIEPGLPGTSRVQANFGWIPRNNLGRFLLERGRNPFGRRLVSALTERTAGGPSPSEETFIFKPLNYLQGRPAAAPANRGRLDIVKKAMLDEGTDFLVTEKLASHIADAPESDLYRMRPRILARAFDAGPDVLLDTMLRGTGQGMLTLNWDVVCPHCRGVRTRMHHLWDVPKRGRCDACKVDFDTSSLNAIEITFQPRPDIRVVDEVLYCSAEPARKQHILVQKIVAPESSSAIRQSLPPGRYRLRTVGGSSYHLYDVEEGANPREITWDAAAPSTAFESGTGGILVMSNQGGSPITFVVEENEADRDALRPRDLFNFQRFRDLFADERLPADLSIDVGTQNIMFVDIVGSTAMYGREGDSGAFALVRAFFLKSHALVSAHRGAIVKTLGDAVMASFDDPLDALRCARAFVAAFDGNDPGVPLRTRVSVNRGPCLAVNLNSGIDYFGQPVNIAAKLQPFTGAGEISLAEPFMEDGAVRAYFAAKGHQQSPLRQADVPGAGGVRYLLIKPAPVKKPTEQQQLPTGI